MTHTDTYNLKTFENVIEYFKTVKSSLFGVFIDVSRLSLVTNNRDISVASRNPCPPHTWEPRGRGPAGRPPVD